MDDNMISKQMPREHWLELDDSRPYAASLRQDIPRWPWATRVVVSIASSLHTLFQTLTFSYYRSLTLTAPGRNSNPLYICPPNKLVYSQLHSCVDWNKFIELSLIGLMQPANYCSTFHLSCGCLFSSNVFRDTKNYLDRFV